MGADTRPKLLASRQAAERLGISRSRLDALRRIPTGPEWGRFEGAIRYDVNALDTWAKQQQDHSPGAEPSARLTPPDG